MAAGEPSPPRSHSLGFTALAVGFVAWACVVAANVYAFGDPAARAVASLNLSHLGQILTHVPRNAPLVIGLFVTLVAAIAPGDAVLRALRLPARDWFDRLAFGAVAGLGVLIATAYALASLQALRPLVEWPLVAGGFVFSVVAIRRWIATEPAVPDAVVVPRGLTLPVWILLGAALCVCLLGALTPDVGFDARWYHLAQAQRYAQHGGFYNLVAAERIWTFALPHYQETLYAFGWAMFGHIGAKLFAWGDAIVTVLAVVAFARAWFGVTAAGALAALLVFATPVVAWSTTTANTDLAASPFVILALHATLTWQATGRLRPLLGAGLFAGLTYGIKPFGALSVVALALVIGWLSHRARAGARGVARDVGSFVAAAFLPMLPALLTAAWMIGDPFFPAAAKLFSARYGGIATTAVLSDAAATARAEHLRPDRLLALPWSLTVHAARYRALMGPIWLAAAPLWIAVPFVAKRDAGVVKPMFAYVAAFCGLMFLNGALVLETRYIETVLPIIGLLIGYLIFRFDWAQAPATRGALLVVLLVFSGLGNELVVPLERDALNGRVMGAEYFDFAYLYEGKREADVQQHYAPVLEYTDAHLDPQRDKIYDDVKLSYFNLYSRVPIFNGKASGGPARLNEWTLSSPDAYIRLTRERCTYVITSKTNVAVLMQAPVWRHLRFVAEFPSYAGGPAPVPAELYAIIE